VLAQRGGRRDADDVTPALLRAEHGLVRESRAGACQQADAVLGDRPPETPAAGDHGRIHRLTRRAHGADPDLHPGEGIAAHLSPRRHAASVRFADTPRPRALVIRWLRRQARCA
jgi:hypothetical protein